MPWSKRLTKTIPNISSNSQEVEYNDYSKGMNNYIANDVIKPEFLKLAQDARMPTLGEYETRKGADFHTDSVGETIDVQQTSTTGAADASISQTKRIAKKITFTTSGRCPRLDVRLKNSASATGTIMVELWSSDGTEPDTMLARSSIHEVDLTSSYAYLSARFINAPSVSATNYWAVVYVQANGTNEYKISSTTNASTGLSSTTSGSTWSASSVDYNVKAYLATDAAPKGLHRAYKSDGTKRTLLPVGTVLYGADDVTGALTSLKTGLSSSATKYRFCTVNDIVYYVNGLDGIRKLSGANFATEAQVTSTNATIVMEHKGLLFFADKNDPNKVFFSNFADYETFTSTDFIYVPSPKTGDPVTAMASLNGTLIIWTKFRKYVLYGSDNATFQLEEAPGKKGTYTQETVTTDKNFAYFLSDDGLYRFNGTSDELISKNNYEDVRGIANKDKCCLAFNKGRLYLYYAELGLSYNNRCMVYNINFNSLESYDTDTYVSFAVNGFNDSEQLFVASSVIGQVYKQEATDNDYTNLGGDINYYLQTHYLTFGSASRFKEIRYWKPRFESQSGSYSITCEYGYDLRDNPQTNSSPNVQGDGYIWGDSGTVWGSFTWGTSPELQSDLSVPGEYRRVQFRYKHYATRQPHKFLGHTFVTETRKLR